MPRALCLLFLALLPSASLCLTLSAQQATGAPEAAFEAASIRPSHLQPGCYSESPPGGRQFALSCVTLRDLIARGWKLNPEYIQGGDAHALSTYYDLRATLPDGQTTTRNSLQPLFRQLLIDRFHVVVHSGTKQVSGYGLLVAKGGAKLKPAGTNDTQQGIRAGEAMQNYIVPGAIQGRGATLSVIASLLSAPAHALVLDRTGIPGTFNVDVHYAYEGSVDANLPDFFTAVEEQLGLKLQPEKLTVDTLVIDHVDLEPTPN